MHACKFVHVLTISGVYSLTISGVYLLGRCPCREKRAGTPNRDSRPGLSSPTPTSCKETTPHNPGFHKHKPLC